jgi:hypothetical protein
MTLPWRAAIPALTLAIILSILTAVHFAKARAVAHRQAAAAQAIRAKADHGDADAEQKLGSRYSYGCGVPQDDAQAVLWTLKAANQGNLKAEHNLGLFYYYGHGVPRDFSEALRWLRIAAAQRETASEVVIGDIYRDGGGVPQDTAEALRWYHLAADQNYPPAYDSLGIIYFRGTGVPQDNAEAVRWFRKSADQSYRYGEYDLAYMLIRGRGVPRDRSAAMRLYRQAAAQGDTAAQRVVTRPFTPWTRFALVLVFLFSLYFLTEFFYEWPAHANDPQRRRFDVIFATGMAVSATLTGVTWYGYSHHKILCIACGINAYTAIRWTLDALMTVVVISLFRKSKRLDSAEPSEPENFTSVTEVH